MSAGDGSPGSTGSPKDRGDGGGHRRRHHWLRVAGALVAVGVVVALALRAPSAAHDFLRAFDHVDPASIPWVVPATVAEAVSFVFYAGIQRSLFGSAGVSVRLWVLLQLAVASSGLRALLPAGSVLSSGWVYEKYRELDISPPDSLFVVLASGFFSTVSILGLLLVGVAVAGSASPWVVALSAVVLVGGSAAFVALVHRLDAVQRLVEDRRGRIARQVRRALDLAERTAIRHIGWRCGAVALLDAAGNWLADVVCLIAAFQLLGQGVPWRALLFAYCASQVAGSLFPMPGGLGAVEGGLVGVLHLQGVPVGQALAAALLYRAITYWGVAIIGGVQVLEFARHPLSGRTARQGAGRPGRDQAPGPPPDPARPRGGGRDLSPPSAS